MLKSERMNTLTVWGNNPPAILLFKMTQTTNYFRSCLLLLVTVLSIIACSEDQTEAMVQVFRQYQAAVLENNPQQLYGAIDENSQEYLRTQLEYLKSADRELTEEYVNQNPYPVVTVDMLARALNHYTADQLNTLSPDDYLDFNLAYLIQLEEKILQDFTFREKLVQTDQRAKLRFSKPLDDERNTIADFEFLKENDQWKLNLLDRLNLLENNARITLKYAEQNTWDYVAEKLNKYYSE